MQRKSMRLAGVATLAVAGLLLSACSSDTESVTEATTAAESSTEESATESAATDECAYENLTTINPGMLTIGTDTPAYPPYFSDDDPTNGEGFESAVAYAVASQLGFAATDVKWEVVPFNTSYAPGNKNFDFDINQISITPERSEVVDFSDGYYTVNQAVVAFNDSPLAGATTISELKDAKLGAQVGTTSLDFVTEVVVPTQEPYVFNDTNDAKSALQNGTIDGIVVDLPTAYYVTAAEFDDSKIVGQFQATASGEEFGLLFQKGNPLVTCVNNALTTLKDSGELQEIQDAWLAGATAPYFTE
ncbi:MAG: ABC transporter substrate-binding protein [Actinomycetia bacterium]|nr:ABC transporter substrate-binding protein [Actinomycetes bacterium]MCH9840130.1 ABC transporter substrate-binding protein [Actinomycetes bacterium]